MARPGITYLDVAKVATQLMEQNIRPSIEEVRKVLGTGSNSTINRHLREWRNKQGSQIELERGLPESLLIAVKGIYEAMKEEAENKIKLSQEEAQQVITDLQMQCAQLNKNYTKLTQENNSLGNALNQSQAEESILQKQLQQHQCKLDEKTAKNKLLNERLNNKKEEMTRLEQQLKHAQTNLDHYRESVKKEREIDSIRFENDIGRLKAETQQHQDISNKLKEENVILLQQVNFLKLEAQKYLKRLEKMQSNHNENTSALQSREIAFKVLNQQQDKLLAEYDRLVFESKADKDIINKLKLKLGNAEGRIDELNTALKKSESNVANFSNKNLFLMQEKTELAAQLKQVQLSTS